MFCFRSVALAAAGMLRTAGDVLLLFNAGSVAVQDAVAAAAYPLRVERLGQLTKQAPRAPEPPHRPHITRLSPSHKPIILSPPTILDRSRLCDTRK
ncbi:hypothetical protein BKA63DRAFT_292219 [Paraphoma chrysanthemicola]|nr:hypothetical protein BKA63DRAFT_292219 [Paraphoma chrysanthemicola]